jgi:hypothetical protein
MSWSKPSWFSMQWATTSWRMCSCRAVPYRGHELRRRKQLQTSPHRQRQDGSTGPSPGQHCLSIGTLQQRTQVFEHSLITTKQYKWDVKKIVNWTISLGRKEYLLLILGVDIIVDTRCWYHALHKTYIWIIVHV